MATTNKRRVAAPVRTHEGAPAKRIDAVAQLKRTVMACLLWEDNFYEDGVSVAQRIAYLVPLVGARQASAIAIEARTRMNLRHAPLLIAREMVRAYAGDPLVSFTIEAIIQRADELSELLSLYWMEGRAPLSGQLKKGLARAFRKFDEYALAKYDRPKAVRLRDVLFLSHARPVDKAQAALWRKLAGGKLATPDTWETELSAGAGKDKRESWQRLLAEERLGALALLRNLRNMTMAGVDPQMIRDALDRANVRRVLPFRFVAAARYAPQFEPELEKLMFRSISQLANIQRPVTVLVDVSGSMDGGMSGKSEMLRVDAAAALAMIIRELSENVSVYAFSNELRLVPPRHGFALRDAIVHALPHGGTYLGAAVKAVVSAHPDNLLIVVTDEQSHDVVGLRRDFRAYLLNVAPYENGVGYRDGWVHIDGFSESVVRYIQESEAALDNERDVEHL